jgi:glycine/D-amino acid oxidase-like deaminating enzyme/nitrite reductase/ring-hydroxylating ferredoxin subunit
MSATRSLWAPEIARLELGIRPLAEDASAEVCVVGAGIAGLMIAQRLASSGRSVLVLDQSGVFSGETGRTTAHLTSVLDSGYARLESMHGVNATRALAESHAAAIGSIERLVADGGIDCDFSRIDGYVYDVAGAFGDGSLESEWQAAQRAGLECELVASAPLPFVNGPALRFPHQAQFDPARFGAALARDIIRSKGRIHAPARAAALENDGGLCVRTLDGRKVRANDVVIATNTPINDVVAMHTKQAPYRTYALAAPIPRGAVQQGLFWDREEPYHYVRTASARDGSLAEGHEWLIVGGEDHKVGQETRADSRWTRLEQWLRAHFEHAGAPLYRWSGQVLEPVDGIAFIGQNPGDEHVFVATGHSGNGMTYGAIAAMVISDLIEGRQNAWASLYAPARKPVTAKAIGQFVRENLNVARRYGDWFVKGDATPAEQIERGQGAVVRRGLKKIAVYVDDLGRVHERSAKCTHLGCVVAWNRAEKSWDCPCHGSRFDAHGRVLAGPAVRDLEPAGEESLHEPAPNVGR